MHSSSARSRETWAHNTHGARQRLDPTRFNVATAPVASESHSPSNEFGISVTMQDFRAGWNTGWKRGRRKSFDMISEGRKVLVIQKRYVEKERWQKKACTGVRTRLYTYGAKNKRQGRDTRVDGPNREEVRGKGKALSANGR